MKRIETFKKARIDAGAYHIKKGGWDGIYPTGPGTFDLGSYTSDIYADNDGDGKISSGDTITYILAAPDRG